MTRFCINCHSCIKPCGREQGVSMDPKSMTMYACGVDWQHEIGEEHGLEGRMPLYTSVESIEHHRHCTDECGIVKLELTEVEWVKIQQLLKRRQ